MNLYRRWREGRKLRLQREIDEQVALILTDTSMVRCLTGAEILALSEQMSRGIGQSFAAYEEEVARLSGTGRDRT